MSLECLKLTAYFGERDRSDGRLLADELLALYQRRGVRVSALFRGAEGFGRLHHVHTDRLLSLSEDLPVVATALDSPARIEALLADVLAVKRRGLLTLERARLLDSDAASEEPALGLAVGDATGRKLTIQVGRRERVGNRPAFVAVCELLYRRGLAGASVVLGVDGLRDGRRTRARFVSRNADVPMSIATVGDGDRIAAVVPELVAMLREPLITLERVRICKRDGEALERPHALAGADARGRALWQKLTVYSSHSATRAGRSLHLEIARRLREGDAAGVTCVNGVWGFNGAHAPHGDRLLQLRRHVPVLTIAIDSPAKAARSFAVIDELTREHGLVTSEVVPAMHALGASERIGALELADTSC
jgi:PII-like signaling protein